MENEHEKTTVQMGSRPLFRWDQSAHFKPSEKLGVTKLRLFKKCEKSENKKIRLLI